MADTHHVQRGIAVRRNGMLFALIASICAMAFALVIAPVHTAQAAAVGSITIDAQWNRDTADQTALAGDTYAIVRIASAELDSDGPSALSTR
ncbi:hypothetical protein [Bifidobacterium olomucense]|uniref:hypothetical protein n=1 Tax=Bifidobacterium olomucense TaxID=2675324 RepID=UPI00145F1ED1|nr:hypothetical protein [Bifidobacterium sp. DSM 109959]